MPVEDVLLDVDQVAEMLGFSVATIRKWVWLGFIPYKKIGKAVRFSVSEIEEWVRGKSAGMRLPAVLRVIPSTLLREKHIFLTTPGKAVR